MELWRYIKIIKRRWWLILLGMLICVGIVGYKLYTEKIYYVGRTTIQEASGASMVGVAIYQSQLMPSQLELQQRLSNLSNIATSREVMQKAVDKMIVLGIDVDTIMSHTKVAPVKDTNIISIEVTLEDNENARLAAEAVSEAFKEYYNEITNKSLTDSRIFIGDQLKTTKQTMQDAQARLSAYKQTSGVVSIDAQTSALIQRLNNIKLQVSTDQAALASANAALERITKELKELEPNKWEKNSETVARNPKWEKLSQNLVDLETEKAGMINGADGQAKRGPNHPEVLDLDRKIVEVKKQLGECEAMTISGTTTAKNNNYSATYDRYVVAHVEAAGANAKALASQTVLASATSELDNIPEAEAVLANLQTDVKAATDTYYTILSKYDEARIRERQSLNSNALVTIDKPYTTLKDNRIPLKLGLAFCLSPLLGILCALLLYYVDSRIRTVRDAEKLLGLPIIAAVPLTRAHKMTAQTVGKGVAEAFHGFTSQLWIEKQNNKLNSLMFMGTCSAVGTTTVAVNTAIALANEGAKVILVDCNMRKPKVADLFKISKKAGMTNLIADAADLEDVLVPTSIEGLLIIPAGTLPQNPVKLLCSDNMQKIARELATLADFVIYDTPAKNTAADAMLIANKVDMAIAVQAAGLSSGGWGIGVKPQLEATSIKIVGAVLNKVKPSDMDIDKPLKKETVNG